MGGGHQQRPDTDRTSELYTNEALQIINRLKSVVAPGATPKRTVNWRKRKAGIETIASAIQIDKMKALADGRGMSTDGLRALCARMLRDDSGNPLEWPRTTKQCNSIIEALKAMNKRDRIFGAFRRAA
ncbi:MAG: hypothetical protein IPN69_08105 [Acidobacteria bacterium]|nr:hypothetical protein [Acidobacteriota bacterium]